MSKAVVSLSNARPRDSDDDDDDCILSTADHRTYALLFTFLASVT